MATTTHRASAALPAAGAWDTPTSYVPISQGRSKIEIVSIYTAGGSNGYPDIEPLWVIAGVIDVPDPVNDSTLTVSGGLAAHNQYDNVAHLLDLQNGSAARALSEYLIPSGATAFRVRSREAGNTGAPGTLTLITEA